MIDKKFLNQHLRSGLVLDANTRLLYADLVDVVGRRCGEVEGGVPFAIIEPFDLEVGIKVFIQCLGALEERLSDTMICGSVDARRVICIYTGNESDGVEQFLRHLTAAQEGPNGRDAGGARFAAGASHFRFGVPPEDAKNEAISALGLALADASSEVVHFREGMTSEAANRRTPFILVVEDDESMLQLIKTTLESSGLHVACARDALEAESAAEREAPDVVVLDVSLPGIDGITLATRLRARPLTRHTPILFVSGHSDPQTKLDGLRHGDDYLCKPFARSELVARIRNLAT